MNPFQSEKNFVLLRKINTIFVFFLVKIAFRIYSVYLDKLLEQVYCELLVEMARLITVGVTHILLGLKKRPRSFDPALRIYRTLTKSGRV